MLGQGEQISASTAFSLLSNDGNSSSTRLGELDSPFPAPPPAGGLTIKEARMDEANSTPAEKRPRATVSTNTEAGQDPVDKRHLTVDSPASPVTASSMGLSMPIPATKLANPKELLRVDKCKVIYFLDNTYAQKGKTLPPVQLAEETRKHLPDLRIVDQKSREVRFRNSKQVSSLFSTIAKHDCVNGTTVAKFCQNPTGFLKHNRLGYDEYCASVGHGLSPDPVAAADNTVHERAARTTLSARHPPTLDRGGDAGLKWFDSLPDTEDETHGSKTRAPLGNEPMPSSTHADEKLAESQDSMPNTSPLRLTEEAQQPRRDGIRFPFAQPLPQAEKVPPGSATRAADSVARQEFDNVSKQQLDSVVGPARLLGNFMPDHTQWTLDTSLLSASLQAMVCQAKSRTHQEFAARGIADRRPAAFLLDPPSSLQQLYSVVTGRRAVQAVKSNIVARASAEDLALSLFGAFLVRVVFLRPGGEMFDDFQAKWSDAACEINEVLNELRTNHDTVLRKAYFRLHRKQDWVEQTLGPIANQLSEDFAARLEQHLGLQRGAGGGQLSGPMTHASAGRFYMIILEALVFKCKISTAREKTKFTWYCGGDAVDSEFMEGSRDDSERVMLTTFPGFDLGEAGPDTDAEVVFKAQILS